MPTLTEKDFIVCVVFIGDEDMNQDILCTNWVTPDGVGHVEYRHRYYMENTGDAFKDKDIKRFYTATYDPKENSYADQLQKMTNFAVEAAKGAKLVFKLDHTPEPKVIPIMGDLYRFSEIMSKQDFVHMKTMPIPPGGTTH